MIMTDEPLKEYDGLAELYKPYIRGNSRRTCYVDPYAPQEAKDAWAKKQELDKKYDGWNGWV